MKDSITVAETSLKTALIDIAQAKRGGIDVTENEKLANDLKERIRKIKAAYMI